MRTVAPSQKALYAQAGVQPIYLMKLTTYTDLTLGTVQSAFYFANRPVLYDYGNTGTVQQFEPVIGSLDSLTLSMDHVPGNASSYTDALTSKSTFTLLNAPYRSTGRDQLLWKVLRGLNLERATVEIATVLGSTMDPEAWHDLRALVGDEHLVRFRGSIIRVAASTDSIQFWAESDYPAIPWIYADNASITDPKDVGERLPIVYGAAKKIKCIGWEVGWTTTLTSTLAQGVGAGAAIGVTDTTGFSLTAFELSIDGEVISIAARADAQALLVIVLRGVSGTYDVNHSVGAAVMEVIPEAIFVAAGHPVSSLPASYISNPYNGEMYSTAQFVPSVSDPMLNGWATLRLTAEAQKALYLEASTAARVTVQPDFSTASAGSYSYVVHTPATIYAGAGNGPARDLSGSTITINNAGSNQHYGIGVFSASQGLSSSRLCSQFRIVANVSYNFSQSHGGIGIYLAPVAGTGLASIAGSSGRGFVAPAWTSSSNSRIETGWMGLGAYETWLIGQTMYFWLEFGQSYDVTTHGTTMFATFSNWGIETMSYSQPVLTRVTDAEATGPGVGYALQVYADVSGPAVPTVFVPGYSFDTASGYSVSGCTVSADAGNLVEGASSLKLTVVEETLLDCETLPGSWSGQRGTLELDTSTYSTGSASWKLTSEQSGVTVWSYLWTSGNPWPSGQDFRDKLLAIDICIHNNMYGLSGTFGVEVYLSSAYDFASGGNYQYTRGRNNGLEADGVWRTLIIDPTELVADGGCTVYTAYGTIDWEHIRGFGVAIYNHPAGTAVLWVDNVRLIPKVAVAQLNGPAGTVDLTSITDVHRIALRGEPAVDFAQATEVMQTFDSTSGFTSNSATFTLDTGDKTEGTGSVRVTQDGSHTYGYITRPNLSPHIDMEFGVLMFDVKLVDVATWISTGVLTATTGLGLLLSTQPTCSANYCYFYFGSNHGLASGDWVTLSIDWVTRPIDSGPHYGPMYWGLIQYFGVWSNRMGTNLEFKIDNMRVVPKHRTFTTPAFADVEVAWSNTGSSGVALPAAYRHIHAPSEAIGAGTFLTTERVKVDEGAPDVDAVETLRVALTSLTVGRGILARPAELWIDNLEVSAAAEGYHATVGGLIEHPTDIERHLITARCGKPASVIDATSFDATYTNLPSVKLGCDLRIFGKTLPDVSMRLAYESRANLVIDETQTGSVYRMLTAGAAPTHSFGSPVRTLTAWANVSETTRDVREMSARFVGMYGFDPTIGMDNRAYSDGLFATPELSEVACVSAATLTALEAKFGRRDGQSLYFQAIQDDVSALEVVGYYMREGARLIPLWMLTGVSWWEAYDLERGDVVAFVSPLDGMTYNARIISVVRGLDSDIVNLRVVEVP